MRVVALISMVLILETPAVTQTDTAAGVEAYLRGDYQRAAEILKPIAAGRGQADPTAAFFMATMYDNGLGVAQDQLRACALYVRASIPPLNGPFGAVATELVRRLSGSMGREAFEICLMTSSMGLDHRFEPVTFVLEPGHWIAWDLKGAVITYQGKEARVPVALAFNQPVFTPIRHTELQVDPTRSTRRHFIEVAMWIPKNLQTWELFWRLFEVVRIELVPIAAEQVTTASGSEPPTEIDLREFVQLRVNGDGEAEWAVTGKTPPVSHVIQSAADREAEIRRTRERQMRESKVDWDRVQDIHRSPSLLYADADGCAQMQVIVYGWSEDRAEAISVRADQRLLQLSTTPRSFDLSARSNGLDVMLHVYQRAVRRSPMCTDVGMPPNAVEQWHATSGTVTIQLETTARDGIARPYRATVHIVGAEFISSTGQRVRQIGPISLTATVG